MQISNILILMLLVQPIHAATVRAWGLADFAGGCTNCNPRVDTGNLSQSSFSFDLLNTAPLITGLMSGSAHSRGYVSAGVLRLETEATMNAVPGLWALATGGVEFSDLIHITSDTLRVGTPVSLMFAASWEFTTREGRPPQGTVAGGYVEDIAVQIGVGGAFTFERRFCIGASYCTAQPPARYSETFQTIVNTRVGDTLAIGGIQGSKVWAYPPSTGGLGFAEYDSFGTALLTIDVLTPGAGFLSDSGATYAGSAVPEPSNFPLLMAILFGGLLLRQARAICRRIARC